MRTPRNPSRRASTSDVFARLSLRLEATAERRGYYSNAETIRLLGTILFGEEFTSDGTETDRPPASSGRGPAEREASPAQAPLRTTGATAPATAHPARS